MITVNTYSEQSFTCSQKTMSPEVSSIFYWCYSLPVFEHIDWLKMVSPTTLYAPNSLHALMQMRVCLCTLTRARLPMCMREKASERENGGSGRWLCWVRVGKAKGCFFFLSRGLFPSVLNVAFRSLWSLDIWKPMHAQELSWQKAPICRGLPAHLQSFTHKSRADVVHLISHGWTTTNLHQCKRLLTLQDFAVISSCQMLHHKQNQKALPNHKK